MNNTRFVKENFRWDGMYLNYVTDAKKNAWGEFVARFKYCRRDRVSFQKFLTANFTVEEYFTARKNGGTPVGILKAKGWISPTAIMLQKEKKEAWDAAIVAKPVVIYSV